MTERADFVGMLGQSALPGAELVAGVQAGDWNQALRTLALAVPDDRPSIAVIDEVPWLVEQDREFEGALQTAWDRHLSAKPVLLVLVGSDLSVMEALQSYGRPFFGRAVKMTVQPLHPADVAVMTGLNAAEAIDAYLVTGGFPEVVQSWRPGMSRVDYLRESLANPLSALLMAGELSLLGEFPETSHSRAVLSAVGSGERTFSAIATEAGGAAPLASGTLSPLLSTLVGKRVLAVDAPLSVKPDTKNKRYRIADPYLRFWLAFLDRGIPLVERGRGSRSWPPSNAPGPPGVAAPSSLSSGRRCCGCCRTTGGPRPRPSEAGGTVRTTLRSISSGRTAIRSRGTSTSSARSSGWRTRRSGGTSTRAWCATCSPSPAPTRRLRWWPSPGRVWTATCRSPRTGVPRTYWPPGRDGQGRLGSRTPRVTLI